MRHGDKVNNLGRKKGHRVALLKNMACSLIMHKRINTTLAKAKALRLYIEPIITRSKDNTMHSRRIAFMYLNNKFAAKELFDVIGPKVGDRPGGYVRVVKLGFRLGDGAETAMIELVDFNETGYGKAAEGAETKKKRTRRSGGAKKAADTTAVNEAEVAAVETSNEEETNA